MMNYRRPTLILSLIAFSISIIVLFLLMFGAIDDDGLNIPSDRMIVLAITIFFMVVSLVILSISIIAAKKIQKEEVPSTHTTEPTIDEPLILPQKATSRDNPIEETRSSVEVDLVSRLLDGDERKIYELIASSSRDVLQKDIVAKRIFSKAKVTRLLDKLENRGLIVRERHGLTNKIKLKK